VVVEPSQEHVNRQPHPKFSLGQQPGRQQRYLNARATAPAGVFGTHRPLNDQLGGHILQFLADFLTDTFGDGATLFARAQRLRLGHDGLPLQMFGKRMSASPLPLTLGALLVLVFEHLPAQRWLPLRLLLKIPGHFGQLSFLFLGQLLGAVAEELAFEFGDLQQSASRNCPSKPSLSASWASSRAFSRSKACACASNWTFSACSA
jgi:hypothetical protein